VVVVVANGQYQRTDFSRLRLAVADGIVGVMVIITVGIVGFGQAVEWVVDVDDGAKVTVMR